MAKKQAPIPISLRPWIEARQQFRLSHAHVQMARELGLNPKKFGKLANHHREPWKRPLPDFIAALYVKRFGKPIPAVVKTIEEIAAAALTKKRAKKTRKPIVYFKFHHCDMDGVALMATLDATYDSSPDSAATPPLRKAMPSAAPPPDFLGLTATGVADFLRRRFRAVRSLPNLAMTVAKASRNLGRDAQYSLAYVWKTPRTRFNVAVSSHRSYGTASLSLPDVKALAVFRRAKLTP